MRKRIERPFEWVKSSDDKEIDFRILILYFCAPGFIFHALIYLSYIFNDNVNDFFYGIIRRIWID